MGESHPLHAKYLRTQNVDKATGRDQGRYPGYCHGLQYDPLTGRKVKKMKQMYERSVAHTPSWWSAWWSNSAMVFLAMVLSAGAASAQTGNCGGPSLDTVVVNPSRVVFKNDAHTVATSYTIGVVDMGNDPTQPGAVFISQTPVPIGTVVPVAVPGEANCYEAPIPLAVQATLLLLTQVRATMNYAVDLGTGAQNVGWSAVSNPFVKAGTLTPLGVVRVKK